MKSTLIAILALALSLFAALRGIATAEGPPGDEPQATGGAGVLANPGTAFTYQGRLTDGGANPTASYGFQFKLYDASSGGNQVGGTLAATVPVTNGLFATDLDFGAGAFPGQARWLGIGVRASGASYTTLSPRQALNPAPLALALPGLWTAQNATSPNLIGGYYSNTVSSGGVGASIGGGGASGSANSVTDDYGTVGGGRGNRAGDNAGTTADRIDATVGGGLNNTASGDRATVGGGGGNTASGENATVGGGFSNTASGYVATVVGGADNIASGSYSLAAGRRAKANHQGAFVWGDSTAADVASTANDQLIVRASGGVTIYTSVNPTVGATLLRGSTAWSVVSDPSLKANRSPVDGRQVLQRLAGIPVESWNYITQDPDTRHMGPMAPDFRQAFGLGEDDQHISTVDADGVALAAIQGLYQDMQEINSRLDERIDDLAARNGELEQRLAALQGADRRSGAHPTLALPGNGEGAVPVPALAQQIAALERRLAALEAPAGGAASGGPTVHLAAPRPAVPPRDAGAPLAAPLPAFPAPNQPRLPAAGRAQAEGAFPPPLGEGECEGEGEGASATSATVVGLLAAGLVGGVAARRRSAGAPGAKDHRKEVTG